MDALEIVLRIQRLIFVNFRGILRYQRNGWSSLFFFTRKDFTFLARSRPLICSAHFWRTVENVQVHWKNHWVWSQSIVWSMDPSPHWKRQISRVLVQVRLLLTLVLLRWYSGTSAESSASGSVAAESQKGHFKRRGFTGTAFQKRERSRVS